MRTYSKVDHENGTKQCAECTETKALAEFPLRKTGYVYAYCKECNARRTREWSSKNRERKAESYKQWVEANPERYKETRRNAWYKRKYGITYEEVRTRLAAQASRCAICEDGITEDTLVIDHCHDLGTVRGILCNRCNISLAPIERPGFLFAAIAYLERHGSGS